jgi:hypothetical protein
MRREEGRRRGVGRIAAHAHRFYAVAVAVHDAFEAEAVQHRGIRFARHDRGEQPRSRLLPESHRARAVLSNGAARVRDDANELHQARQREHRDVEPRG